jgi:hypothetical protein|nr:MAG TPA: hypothetical protein [Caudoviricetes sp.]
MSENEKPISERLTVNTDTTKILNAPVHFTIPQTRTQYAYHLIREEMNNRRPSIRYSYRGTTINELQLNEKIGKSMIGLEFAGFVVKDAIIYNNKVRFILDMQADPDDIELEIRTGANAAFVHTFGG